MNNNNNDETNGENNSNRNSSSSSSNNNNNNNDDGEYGVHRQNRAAVDSATYAENHAPLRQRSLLIRQLRDRLRAEPAVRVRRSRATHVLEAAAGDVNVAAQLYRDDWLARTGVHRDIDDDDDDDENEDNDDEEDDNRGSQHEFESQDESEDGDDPEPENRAIRNDKACKSGDSPFIPAASGSSGGVSELCRRLFVNDNNNDSDPKRDDALAGLVGEYGHALVRVVFPPPLPPPPLPGVNEGDANDNYEENDDQVAGRHAVSDDEVAFRRRASRPPLAQGRSKKGESSSAHAATLRLLQRKNANNDNGEEDAYLSDTDWIWEWDAPPTVPPPTSRDAPPPADPNLLLWGECDVRKRQTNVAIIKPSLSTTEESATTTAGSKKRKSMNDDNDVHNDIFLDAEEYADTALNRKDDSSLLFAADDDISSAESKKIGIPRTWMNASFHMATENDEDEYDDDGEMADTPNVRRTALGLAVRPPRPEDWAYSIWEQTFVENADDVGTYRFRVPPPYHCRGVTAVLAVVTGIMYTGAVAGSQGGSVSCTTTLRPSLLAPSTATISPSPAMRQRDFDERLTDALTAILYIAAKASVDRKQRALEPLRTSTDPADKWKWRMLSRRLRLCPTCWWESDVTSSSSNNGGDTVNPPASVADGSRCHVRITTSYTHMDDLRSYVRANLRQFTSSGGVALFLEMVLRIHGRGAVHRQLRHAATEKSNSDLPFSFVQCSCDARHAVRLRTNPQWTQQQQRLGRSQLDQSDTSPPGHDCCSIELLSLLLTGRVQSKLVGWSTGSLGLGLLADTRSVGRGLTRPDRPVWILRGPTCYSVLWKSESSASSSDDAFRSIDSGREDHPGPVAILTHWSAWYRIRNTSRVRLVAPCAAPSTHSKVATDKVAGVISSIRSRQRHFPCFATTSIAALIEVIDSNVKDEDAAWDVTTHPDDPTHYPLRDQYRLWRYAIRRKRDDNKQHDGNNEDIKDDDTISSYPMPMYRPFFRLTAREQRRVESKFGPPLVTMLRTRWPHAMLDCLRPADAPAVV